MLFPCSRLATTRMWHTTTLAEQLAVADADGEALYAAMDWLLARQERVEKKLARRHLAAGAQVLYDVSSSYYEGHCCPLAQFDHNRDGKRGLPIIVYGVLTNAEGCPVAVDVYPGNTGDPSTVVDQLAKLQGRFGLERVWDADPGPEHPSRSRVDLGAAHHAQQKKAPEMPVSAAWSKKICP